MIPKFRAWDKLNNEMSVVEQINFYRGEFESIGYGISFLRGADKVELMQSTGLFDKNNTEIFEGDIVLVLDSPYTVFYDNERGSYRLKPHDDRWNVDYMSNFSHGGNFEVVGNIYENKEYL